MLRRKMNDVVDGGMATQPGIHVELTLATSGASLAIAILVIGEGKTRW